MEDRFSLRGTLAIVVTQLLLTAAVNGNATAATGLVAPGLQEVQLPRGPGLLIDPDTRIPGLVAKKSLEHPEELQVRRVPDAEARVQALARELREAHAARAHANVALGLLIFFVALAALGARSAYLARVSILVVPAMLALGLAWRSTLALLAGALALALPLAAPARAFRPLCIATIAGALLVLWQWPVTNALATIGPHPDGGHRFYGVTNQVETLLLPSALIAGLVVAPIALAAIGWSKAGADGGGLVTYAAGYAMLALRSYGRLTLKRVLVAAAAVVAAALLLVALDAATGGSSHVTRAFDTGLPGELAHRVHVSAQGATKTVGNFLMFASGVTVLLLLARRRPRPPLLDAMLVALAVSFVVNDTPQDVALWGALGALSLLAWERAR
jgi:hypothetical protein